MASKFAPFRSAISAGFSYAPSPADADVAESHARWMAEAVELARAAQGWVWPNPAVGCVIVRDGRIVGRGQTRFGGRPHAERVALDDASDQALGSSLYVTLEPCCHWGKTPPCSDAIIAAGVRTVFASLQDPDPRVNGGGFRKLREAGVDVHVGLGADVARKIAAGFFHRIATGRPLAIIGDLPFDPSYIPEGCDAVLRSEPDRIWLLTRAPYIGVKAEQMAHAGSAIDLLGVLGKRGVTTVWIAGDDPLSASLGPADVLASTAIASGSAPVKHADPHEPSGIIETRPQFPKSRAL